MGFQNPMAQGRSTRIISMTKWIRSSRLSIKNCLSLGDEWTVLHPGTGTGYHPTALRTVGSYGRGGDGRRVDCPTSGYGYWLPSDGTAYRRALRPTRTRRRTRIQVDMGGALEDNALRGGDGRGLQGYLAHKKTPPPLGPPYDHRRRPTEGSFGGAVSHERGTAVTRK